jgi:hypothetical protein
MKLTPPKQITFWASLILAVLGVLGQFAELPLVTQYSFWLVAAGFVLLALGNALGDL